MKNILNKFRNFIRFIISIITSREFAAIYCFLGTIVCIAHTYYLVEMISSLSGGWKVTQAIMMSVFISSSLLYFTAISDNEQTKESRKIRIAVTTFVVIEILINIYYYTRHIILDSENPQYFDFVFAILISCLVPITIKLYSSHIRAKEWLSEFEDKKEIAQLTDESDLYLKISEDILNIKEDFEQQLNKLKTPENIDFSERKEKIFSELEEKITESFDKKSKLFLTAFENKLINIQKQKAE